MPNARERIQMTQAEIAAFLDEAHTLQVASINPDGAPHLVPMWFIREGDAVAFWTYAKSQKVLNLRRDPRITVLAEAGHAYEELRGVMMRGTAEIIEDWERVIDFGMRLYPKYWGDAPGAREHMERMGAKRVVVVVHADHIATWDHRKM